MKKGKLILWLVIIAIFALVIFQNQEFLLSDQSLGINLYFVSYHTFALPVAVLFAAVFLIGCLIAYICGLANRYHLNRKVKSMQQAAAGHESTIATLRKEIESLKAENASPRQIPEQTVEPAPDTVDSPSVPRT